MFLLPTFALRRVHVGVIAAIIALPLCARAVAATPSVMLDTDLPGWDYQHFDLPRASPHLCQESCLRQHQCRAWTFVKPGLYGDARAACWLKARVPAAHADPCCVSGVR